MCGKKPKADPRIAQEQEKQRADIAAAKAAEQAKVSEAKAAALEEQRAMVARIAELEAAAKRQVESNKVVATPKPTPSPTPSAPKSAATPPPPPPSMAASTLSAATTDSPETPDVITETAPVKSTAAQREKRIAKFGTTATAGRRTKRSGSRGRRSLITGLGGGIGYFNRFGG
jgi:hypothetical protein